GPGWAEQSHPLRQKRKTPPRGAFCVSDGEDWVRTHPGSTNSSGTNSDDRRSAPSAARGEAQDGPSNPTLSARNASAPDGGVCVSGGDGWVRIHGVRRIRPERIRTTEGRPRAQRGVRPRMGRAIPPSPPEAQAPPMGAFLFVLERGRNPQLRQ